MLASDPVAKSASQLLFLHVGLVYADAQVDSGSDLNKYPDLNESNHLFEHDRGSHSDYFLLSADPCNEDLRVHANQKQGIPV